MRGATILRVSAIAIDTAACHNPAMKSLTVLFATIFVCCATSARAEDLTGTAQQIGTDLWKASGGENWSKVKELRFTFNVEVDGKVVSTAQHHWNVAAGTDHVKWKDKDFTVDLKSPPQEGDGKAAYQRWVNDSYWLLAPLKIRDPGVKSQSGGTKEVGGRSCETLQLSFEQVGLTPTDQYLLYIDPQTKLMCAWDYIPSSGQGMQATWEKYQTFGGLNLATEHHFENKAIKFSGVEVVADK